MRKAQLPMLATPINPSCFFGTDDCSHRPSSSPPHCVRWKLAEAIALWTFQFRRLAFTADSYDQAPTAGKASTGRLSIAAALKVLVEWGADAHVLFDAPAKWSAIRYSPRSGVP